MSSLWTPDGERPVSRTASPRDPAAGAPATPDGPDAGPTAPLRAAAEALGVDLDAMTEEERAQLEAELVEMMQARRRIAETPAPEMLANHLMRFFDLASIYLEADPPGFEDAATVIETVRAVLDGVGDRFGEHEELLRSALGQMQMAFVQVKDATTAS